MATAVPGPEAAATPTEFVECLRRLKAWSGRSFRSLERQAAAHGFVMPTSTLSGALKRDTLPSIELVTALVTAVGGTPEEVDAWIRARRALAQSEAPVTVTVTPGQHLAPRLLPPDRPRYVGRDEEMALAGAILRDESPQPATVLVTGPAGIGKTAFAVRVGHMVAADFPGGQLYVNLDGMGADQAAPEAVLGVFLRALGVHAGSVPAGLTNRVHLYRTLLAQRRVLVILDNAADGRQVRDLLPSGDGCAAIVTSRTSLADLDGVRMPLGALTEPQAIALFTSMVGEQRVDAEPSSVREIVARCSGLPLAVWIAGARLAARPHWPLWTVAQSLADEHRKLDELTVGDIAVRASLELSYRNLPEPAQAALRLLALSSAPTFAPWALAALAGISLTSAERLIDDLVDVHVVEAEAALGKVPRYRLHDLVRAYARERGAAEDSPSDQAIALHRLVEAALHLAELADARLSADFQGLSSHRLAKWRVPDTDAGSILPDPLSWFDDEHAFLMSIVEHGLGPPSASLAAGLATSLTTFFQIRSHFDDWRRLQTRALSSVVGAGDARSAAKLHRSLGELTTILDYYDEAVIHFERALETVSLEDPEYHASSLAGLAYVYRLLGRYQKAEIYFGRAAAVAQEHDNLNCLVYVTNGLGVLDLERGNRDAAQERFAACLRLSRQAGYRPGESQALRCLGMALRAKADYPAAADVFEQAAAITDAMGDRLGSTHACSWLGDVLVRQGRVRDGVRMLAECLWYYRESGNRWGEAAVLYCLGNAHLTAGSPARARSRVRTAVAIWRRIDTPHWLANGFDLLAAAERACGNETGAQQARAQAEAIRARLS